MHQDFYQFDRRGEDRKLAKQVDILTQQVDHLSVKVDNIDNHMNRFFDNPVVEFIKNTSDFWKVANKTAGYILKVAEKLAEVGRTTIKVVMFLVMPTVFLYYWLTTDFKHALELTKHWWP